MPGNPTWLRIVPRGISPILAHRSARLGTPRGSGPDTVGPSALRALGRRTWDDKVRPGARIMAPDLGDPSGSLLRSARLGTPRGSGPDTVGLLALRALGRRTWDDKVRPGARIMAPDLGYPSGSLLLLIGAPSRDSEVRHQNTDGDSPGGDPAARQLGSYRSTTAASTGLPSRIQGVSCMASARCMAHLNGIHQPPQLPSYRRTCWVRLPPAAARGFNST